MIELLITVSLVPCKISSWDHFFTFLTPAATSSVCWPTFITNLGTSRSSRVLASWCSGPKGPRCVFRNLAIPYIMNSRGARETGITNSVLASWCSRPKCPACQGHPEDLLAFQEGWGTMKGRRLVPRQLGLWISYALSILPKAAGRQHSTHIYRSADSWTIELLNYWTIELLTQLENNF